MSTRLSPVETIMWRVGHDPVLRMAVGSLLILDRTPDRAALVERLVAATQEAPRLTWRPNDPSRSRARPAWVEIDDLDVGAHLRVLAVPAPGELRHVLDLAALLAATPFETDRPPWDVTVIEGLEGGKAAVFLRADHVLTDGLGGRTLAALLFDRTAPAPGPAPAPAVDERDTATEVEEAADDGEGDHRPGTVTVTIDLAKAARPLAAGVTAVLNLNPFDTVVRGMQRGLDAASSVSRQLVVTDGPFADLAASHSAMSRFEILSVPDARAAALALGGSRNDLLVAAAACGLGQYLEGIGQLCPQLRLATPAGRRRADSLGGNSFAPTRLEIPTDTGHPGPQFGVVAERLAAARGEPAVRLTEALATTISRLPTRVLVPALHAQAASVDFVATALPGLRRTPRLCGAEVEACYPFGPRLGCPINLTAFGNGERLDVGISLDPMAITDPDALLACLAEAFRNFAPTATVVAQHKARG